MAKPNCTFDPLITGITPLFLPTQVADQAYAKGDPITIVYTFIIQGHHFGEVDETNIDLGNFSDNFQWNVVHAHTIDSCHILVQATVTSPKWGRAPESGTVGAGSGDLTIVVDGPSPPPPPPPPPPPMSGKKKKKEATAPKNKRAENAFTVFYPALEPKKAKK